MGMRTFLNKIIKAGELGEGSTQRALALPSLRPYLPGRRLLWRLLLGIVVLAGMGLRVTRAGLSRAVDTKSAKPEAKDESKPKDESTKKPEPKPSLGDTAERAGAVVLAITILGTVTVGIVRAAAPHLQPYAPIIVSVAAAGLIAAAWAVAPAAPPKEPIPAPASTRAEPSPEELIERDRAAMLELLEEATRGRNGIHLDPLYELIGTVPYFAGIARPQLGALLAGLGVPVVRSLSVDGVEGRTGVRRAAIEVLLAERSPGRSAGSSRATESAADQHVSRALSDGSRSSLGTALGPP